MKCLVIGSGGREHAIVLGLAQDPSVAVVHAAPGNPGIADVAQCHPVAVGDPEAIADLAEQLGCGLVVIGPEGPLVAGAADAVRARGIACFGPSAAAARLEGSKAFAKEVMAAAGVPTAAAVLCTTPAEIDAALDRFARPGVPFVVKDDGLAAGKGVVVTTDRDAAREHALACGRVVIEEYLDGPEASVFCVTDGTTVRALLPAQDFKRAYDGDTGPNTGGMGAYAPLSWAPKTLADDVVRLVAQPTIDEMARRGTPFVGLLYVGLALTSNGMRVVEFNARFGDPETQVVLPLLRTPLGTVLAAAATGRLADLPPLAWEDASAVTIVVAAEGYPAAPVTGDAILGIDEAEDIAGVTVYQAGTALVDGELRTAGGRVLAVTAVAPPARLARIQAYRAVDCIAIRGSHHRFDIATYPEGSFA